MEWAQILVIILSIFLALFLLVGIILAIMLIRLTRQINHITDSAQRTAETVEKAVVGITTVTSPMFLAKALAKQLKKFKGK